MCNLSDYVIENGVLTKYQGGGGDIVIPKEITKVGDYAFSNCVELTSVILPESVLSIGKSALCVFRVFQIGKYFIPFRA